MHGDGIVRDPCQGEHKRRHCEAHQESQTGTTGPKVHP
jgi:hypothetical protein